MAALTLGNLLVSFQISVWVCVLRHVKIVKLARDVGALDMFYECSLEHSPAASVHQQHQRIRASATLAHQQDFFFFVNMSNASGLQVVP